MFYLYILKSVKTNEYYTGSTNDLKRRFKEHNAGKTKSTKGTGPWMLVYYEAFLTYTLAKKAEMFYKTGQGRRQLKQKLNINV